MIHRPPSPPPARTRPPAAARPRAPRLAAVFALFTAAFAAALLATPAPAAAAEWALYGGVFDLAGGEEAAELGVEARFRLFDVPLGSFDLPVEPAAGVMGNSDGGGYAYASLRLPLHELWGAGEESRWRLVPFTGAGLYAAGDGKDLGGPVEFRSGLEVSVRAGERWWIGLSYYHLSNAVLYDLNPGEESLVLVLSRR